MLKKVIYFLLIVIEVVGCATAEPVLIGTDTYLISQTSAGGMFKPMGELKAEVINHANSFAASKGKIAIAISSRESPAYPLHMPNFEYQFRLVDKDNPPVSVNASIPPVAISQQGTGFWINSEFVVTNSHVVKGASVIKVFVANEALLAELVSNDQKNDLAILKVRTPQPNARPVTLTRTSQPRLGERVYAIGFPLSSILGNNPTISEGLVSKLTGVDDDPSVFQLSAAIQPGSSGSPVFDTEGNVIGIISSTLKADSILNSGGSIPQNVNFAIRVTYLMSLINSLGVKTSESAQVYSFPSPEELASHFQSSILRIQVSK